MNGYHFSDISITSFKCLNEGFYLIDDKYYSCYESCGFCDTYKKPIDSDYNKHYCDTCGTKYPYFINVADKDENENIINYKNCYEKCPVNTHNKPNSMECISYCPILTTNENTCVDYCDSKNYKYFLEEENMCYNYIPDNYYTYIDDDKYIDNNDSPIVKLSTNCPENYSYDSSFSNICIKTINDIFYLVDSDYLIKYNNPKTIWFKDNTIFLRTYSMDLKETELMEMGKQYPTTDISKCESFLKNYYDITESIVISDVYDSIEDKYKYKIFSTEGKELYVNICIQNNIIICKINEYLPENSNECTKCPNHCYKCSYESIQQNLCILCNNNLNYYEKLSSNTDNSLLFECINEDNKPPNYHLNIEKLRYEPCYDTCENCFDYGNSEIHNCITCINGYIIRDDKPYNCVLNCTYYYYFNDEGKYRCTETNMCPEGLFLIENKKKCVKDCSNDYPYIYQFKIKCLDECPENTTVTFDNKCIYEDTNKCLLYEQNLNKKEYELINDNNKFIDELVKKYALDHKNINKEIYNYKNKDYNCVIYKSEECLNYYIDQNKININKIDFNLCYSLLQNHYSDNIIIILIDFYRKNQSPYTYYNFYHPETGVELDSNNICSSLRVNKTIDLFSLGIKNIEDIISLFSQGINVFNLSSPFYNDICFHFESPNGKDMTLKQRMIEFYPNIKICDDGCENMGINEKYEILCECTFSNIMNNDLINNDFTGEIFDVIQETNIQVVKCYEDIIKYEFIIKFNGSTTILIFIFIQIIINIIYYRKDIYNIRNFPSSLINSFLIFSKDISTFNHKTNKEIIIKLLNENDSNNNIKDSPIKRNKHKYDKIKSSKKRHKKHKKR